MGVNLDQPYWVLLPWLVFAVINRTAGPSVGRAALAACATALVLAFGTRRTGREIGIPNVLLWGASLWFAGLAIVGAIATDPNGVVESHGRSFSAAGFAVIAAFSLLFAKPITEFYSRPRVRRRDRERAEFRRANVVCTANWIVVWSLIAASQAVGNSVNSEVGASIFRFLIPVLLIMLGAQRGHAMWEEFAAVVADDELADPTSALAFEWELGAQNARSL
jgi:hypothetical protein